jgi:hypothetical protein
MKNIQPIYATFELSKLLKEKEWQQRTKMVWLDFLGKQHLREVNLSLELNNAEYDAPEQWQVVEWLRVNHGIWVWVRPYKDHAADNNDPIQHQMNVYKNGVTVSKEFNSHEEAYSAAFDYILNNLI